MDQPKQKVKIEPPKTITASDMVSIILVSIFMGGLVFAGLYYFRSVFLKKAAENKAVSSIVAPERITASQLKPQFTARDFKLAPVRNMPVSTTKGLSAHLPSQAAPIMIKPQSENIRKEVSADDLMGIPPWEDYDTRCNPGYYGHAPCAAAQRSLIPNFSETINR